jgi:hypothetical protein
MFVQVIKEGSPPPRAEKDDDSFRYLSDGLLNFAATEVVANQFRMECSVITSHGRDINQ